MGSGVRAARTEHRELVREMVLSVWDSVSEDGMEPDYWEPDFHRRGYIAAYDDDKPVGVLMAHPANATAIQVHVHIPPDARGDKYEIGQAMLDWIWENTKFETVIAYIPVIFPNVSTFAKKLGFINVGLIKRAHRKNGELHDMEVLQLERGEDE